WTGFRDQYLDECMRLEGRGTRCRTVCPHCPTEGREGVICCRNCFNGGMMCIECMIERHRHLPLHIIEHWNGSFFQHIWLHDIGLRLQMGHEVGEGCPFKKTGPQAFVVLHTNGIHYVGVDFCKCPGQGPPHVQLLRASWWPATPLEKQTCATMAVLRQFHLLNLQGKISAYDFYRAL
ncbi:hypothetical protein PLICRDRAFT_62996, partial [Plicaturopsis crispa FD-325 SS-3]